jgi:four helix bundle protein
MSYKKINETKVHKLAFELAVKIFEISKRFPKEETYSLTNLVRRSSRSVCPYLFRSTKEYPVHFVSKYQIQIWKMQKRKHGLNLQ